MSKVAEQLRREELTRLRRMSPGERVEEALALGDAAIGAYAEAHGLSRSEARRDQERAAQQGRAPSKVMREIVG